MPSDKTPTEWDLENNPQTARAVSEIPSVRITVGAEDTNVANVAVQVVDGDGVDLALQLGFVAWLSDDEAGEVASAAPSGGVAIGTNGILLIENVTDQAWIALTDADGALDIDVTEAGDAAWYLNVLLPGGSIVVSDVITLAA